MQCKKGNEEQELLTLKIILAMQTTGPKRSGLDQESQGYGQKHVVKSQQFLLTIHSAHS